MCSYSDMTDAEDHAQERFLTEELAKGLSHERALSISYARLCGRISAILTTESRNMESDVEARRRAIVARLNRV